MTKLTRPMLRIHKQFVDKGLLLLSQDSVQLLKKVALRSGGGIGWEITAREDFKALMTQISKESSTDFEVYS